MPQLILATVDVDTCGGSTAMADRVGQHMGNYRLVSGHPTKSVN